MKYFNLHKNHKFFTLGSLGWDTPSTGVIFIAIDFLFWGVEFMIDFEVNKEQLWESIKRKNDH